MKNVRIIERTMPCGRKKFTIQQRHFLFFWWWVDAWVNSSNTSCRDTWNTLEESKKNLYYFDGTKCSKVVIYQNK